MGLFDYVNCEAPLPDGKPTPPELFQTKDFDNPYLEKYTITKDGRLVHHAVDYEWIKDEAAPLGYWQRATPAGDVDTNWHGFLNFYDYNTSTKEWREFDAKFTDGKLVEIVQRHSRD